MLNMNEMMVMYTSVVFFTILTVIAEILSLRDNIQNKARKYSVVFILLGIATLSEWLGTVFFTLDVEYRGLALIFRSIEYGLVLVIPSFMLNAIHNRKVGKVQTIFCSVVAVIYLVNIYLGFFFSLSPELSFREGPLYNVFLLISIAMSSWMCIDIMIFVLKQQDDRNLILIVVALMLFAGSWLLQRYAIPFNLSWAAANLSATLLCFHFLSSFQNQAVKELERAIEEEEKATKSKASFLARMSHDLRTPINGIMGMTRIARDNLRSPSVVSDSLDKIDLSSQNLLDLLNDILQMTSLESGRQEMTSERFNLAVLMEQCISANRNAAKERGVVIVNESSLDATDLNLIGSPVHVRQIFINILSNSVKYNRVGGFVRIRSEKISQDGDNVRYRFIFSDTGIGMDKDFLPTVFEPFSMEDDAVASKRNGTGLGMSIVKELVDQMAGSVKAESERGRGSVFTVELPFILAGTEEKDENEEPMASLEGRHVLLVEDNELNREIALYMLEDQGMEVECAENGEEAVTAFLASPMGHFDVILMDIMMPVMNGLQAARAIRSCGRHDSDVPIIAMTANAFSEDRKNSKDAGMDAHLAKPLEEDQIMETMSILIARKDMRDGRNVEL